MSDINNSISDDVKSPSTEMMNLESQLNYILQHIADGNDIKNYADRWDEIKRHAISAKKSFNWLDNFCTIKRATE